MYFIFMKIFLYKYEIAMQMLVQVEKFGLIVAH